MAYSIYFNATSLLLNLLTVEKKLLLKNIYLLLMMAYLFYFSATVVDRNEGFLNRHIVKEGNVDTSGFSCYIAVTLYNFTYI